MLRRIITILIISLLIGGQIYAHTGKPKHHVIIDTDGALDDMRSISMFLSGNKIQVLAITCSQGSLLPDSIYYKVKSLLADYHHEGIPVGVGDETGQKLPAWATFSQETAWGNTNERQYVDDPKEATKLLSQTTQNEPDKIILVALGSLKTYADWIKANPKAIDLVDKIVWYNNTAIEEGFNYKASPESYDYIRETNIELLVVGNNSDKYFVDEAYVNLMKTCNSLYAKQIGLIHEMPEVVKRIKQEHIQFWDDFVPLFITMPEIFKSETKENITLVTLKKNLEKPFVYEQISKMLESSMATNNRVFKTFPVDTSLYKPEYAKMLNTTLDNFGAIEWKSVCMTNEIHGHTGIYSIIGAKMGIRAMEYYNCGVNNLQVTTYAGHKPPLSCFNDGVQFSTGATIGQGLITISDTIFKIPTAIFRFDNQVVKISIKPEVIKQMQKDIKYGVKTYGLKSEEYWLYIEELAINYWMNYNRFEIFDIE